MLTQRGIFSHIALKRSCKLLGNQPYGRDALTINKGRGLTSLWAIFDQFVCRDLCVLLK
jgi:hypothetical protein